MEYKGGKGKGHGYERQYFLLISLLLSFLCRTFVEQTMLPGERWFLNSQPINHYKMNQKMPSHFFYCNLHSFRHVRIQPKE
jgi:hypothetical protein